jgi:hypothetical protein
MKRVDDRLGKDVMANPYALNMGYPRASVVIDRTHQTPAYLLRRKLVLGVYYLRLRFGLRALDTLLGAVYEGIANSFLVYDAVRNVLGARAVVDSSKSYLQAVGVYSHDPESVRVVLLTRDGRGVLFSNLKRGVPRRRAVDSWRNQYTRAVPLLRAYLSPEHLIQVKYEDLATSPE